MMDKIELFIGLMVLGIIVFAAVIPQITAVTTPISVSEQWNGVAGISHPMAYYPIISIASNSKNTSATAVNSTALNGANGTRTLALSLPLVTNGLRSLTITYASKAGDAVSVSINGNYLGNLSQTGSDTWATVNNSWLVASNNVTFVNNGTLTNITNISLPYTYWAAYTNYTSTNLAITPASNGTYLTSYSYGPVDPTSTNGALVALIVLLIIVAFILLVIAKFGVF